MRLTTPTLLIAISFGAGRIVIGCSDPASNGADAAVAIDGATADANAPDASAMLDAQPFDFDAPVPHPGDDAGVGYVRVAHVNQGLGSVDFCLGEGNFATATPALAAFATTGVTFPGVARYVAASTRTTAVRIVTAGVTTCATGIGADTPLKVGDSSYTTVVTFGTSAADLSVTAMGDLAPSAGFQDGGADPLVRVVHAAAGIGTLNVGQNSLLEGTFTANYPNLAFGKTAQPPATDALGYRRNGYLVTLSASFPGAATDLARWTNIEYGDPAVGTLFLVSDPVPQKVRALFCKRDSQVPKTGTTNPSCALLLRDP
jgi:hypothetical protein